jgi:hypothetical protein
MSAGQVGDRLPTAAANVCASVGDTPGAETMLAGGDTG